jgi:hypothetical protein
MARGRAMYLNVNVSFFLSRIFVALQISLFNLLQMLIAKCPLQLQMERLHYQQMLLIMEQLLCTNAIKILNLTECQGDCARMMERGDTIHLPALR